MRRPLGLVLVALGAFLIVLAPLAKWYVAPRLATAPLNCSGESAICHDKVSRSPSSGEASVLFNPATLASFPADEFPISMLSVRTVAADVDGGRLSHHTIYDESLITTATPKGQAPIPLDTQTAKVAFDGHTSKLIDCCRANGDGAPFPTGAVGAVMPYKFGFGTLPKDTRYYDTVLNQALPMKYVDTEKVLGLKVYKFVQTIPPTKYAVLQVPANLVGGSNGDPVDAPRTYANTRTVWVEPVTGAIVKGQEAIQQALVGADGQPKVQLLNTTLTFTDANIKASVKLAKDGKSKLQLLQIKLPVGGLIVGLILVAGGIGLLRRRDDVKGAPPAPATPVEVNA
jgi:hypothetical protein